MINETIKIGDRAILTTYVHIPNNKKKRHALIVCPGGGYIDTSPNEGECVALEFLTHGYQTFVLDYSTLKRNPECCQHPQQLIELANTIQLIKSKEEEWFIDNIFLLGFSAGGNLVANYGNEWYDLATKLSIIPEILKPSGLFLCYPALDWEMLINDLTNFNKEIDAKQVTGENKIINAGYELARNANMALFKTESPSTEQMSVVSPCFNINSNTPPTFIWHTVQDELVSVKQVYDYALKLNECGIRHEVHVFEHGHHGLSLANKFSATADKNIDKSVSSWITLALNWYDKF